MQHELSADTTSIKEKFKEGPKEPKPLTKEETIRLMEENVPIMRLQDEYEELEYNFKERRVKDLELQIREIEAINYLSSWKRGQQTAMEEQKRREEFEKLPKAEQDRI